jgi:hypothetical protein
MKAEAEQEKLDNLKWNCEPVLLYRPDLYFARVIFRFDTLSPAYCNFARSSGSLATRMCYVSVDHFFKLLAYFIAVCQRQQLIQPRYPRPPAVMPRELGLGPQIHLGVLKQSFYCFWSFRLLVAPEISVSTPWDKRNKRKGLLIAPEIPAKQSPLFIGHFQNSIDDHCLLA